MWNGVINVYKEKGYTSHDVVAKMRGIFGQKKIGHTGTLDPDAEGVLPVCLGSATRLCGLLTDRTKSYRAVLLLGVETDTQDAGGRVLRERPVRLGPEELREAAEGFVGGYDQLPPMYSALKINGKKLVDLARRGIEVERKPRKVEIFSLQIEAIELPRVTMSVECGKGTYIRTLCRDIGERLGCGGCMESLIRTRSGAFRVEDAHRLSELEAAVSAGEAERFLIPADACLSEYPGLQTTEEGDRLLQNGNPLPAQLCRPRGGEGGEAVLPEAGLYRLYDSGGRFAALYRRGRGERLKPEKMFPSPREEGRVGGR